LTEYLFPVAKLADWVSCNVEGTEFTYWFNSDRHDNLVSAGMYLEGKLDKVQVFKK
jgi:hypothetical protein